MRLYLDTSALVKLYVEEEGSSSVRNWIGEARTVATSIIAYVESRAAFARRRRERSLSNPAYLNVVRDFEADWERYLVLQTTTDLVKSAARLAEGYALRAYDSLHLASARALKNQIREPVCFASWDDRLNSAARREALDILTSQAP